MSRCEVPINDLHGLVSEKVDDYLSEAQVHLSEAGQEVCARADVGKITAYL